jgi:hypothetical protein
MTPNSNYTTVFRGQLAIDWERHRSFLLKPLWVMLLFTFILPLFNNTAIIAIVYGVLAWVIGVRLSSADATGGTEEFALATPATRTQRYLIHAGMILVIPLTCWITMALMVHNAAPRLWALWVETGYTAPYDNDALHSTRFLAVSIPSLIGALCFSLGARARAAVDAFAAPLISLAIFAVVASVCSVIEARTLGRPNGTLLMKVSAIAALPVLLSGLPGYRRKEVTGGGAVHGVIAIAAAIVLAIMLLTALLYGTQSRVTQHSATSVDGPPTDSVQAPQLNTSDVQTATQEIER